MHENASDASDASDVQPQPLMKCQYCKLSFFDGELQEHLKKKHYRETWKATVTCTTCHKNCESANLLDRHVYRHHPEQVLFTCTDCAKEPSFRSFERLLKHREKRHPRRSWIKCFKCDDLFMTPEILEAHVANQHMNVPCVCPYPECCVDIYTKSKRKAHIIRHSANKPFQCRTCHKRYKHQNNLVSHHNNPANNCSN